MTPNQIVAFRLRHARLLHGWTQETAAEKLAPLLGEHWSKASFSAAERSVTGERVRQFTASDLVAFASVFGLTVSYFLTPPPGVDSIAAPGATVSLTRSDLADVAGSPPEEKIRALEVAHVEGLQAKGIKAELGR
jgi:transcriptional regulator with XRE-family HTH domain